MLHNNARIVVRLPERDLSLLKQLASLEDAPMSAVVRRLIRQHARSIGLCSQPANQAFGQEA